VKFWLDAQLSPALVSYISERFKVEVAYVVSLGLLHATDTNIFQLAREQPAIVITKNRDFLDLSKRFGPPLQVVWLRSGNTSNALVKMTFRVKFAGVLRLLSEGEAVVELHGITKWAWAPGVKPPE